MRRLKSAINGVLTVIFFGDITPDSNNINRKITPIIS